MWYNVIVEESVRAQELVIEEGTGRRIKIPVDHKALSELETLFPRLSATKQDWLLARFPFSDTDEEATETVNRNGKELAHSTVKGWKQKDLDFSRTYSLLAGRCIDWSAYISMSVEAGNAVLGALAVRELLKKPWAALTAREATAKMTAAQASLDRVVGKGKQELDVRVLRIEELVPER